MKVSILILTKNAESSIEKLLKGIYSQSFKEFEIIVIDSGSDDSTVSIAKVNGCSVYEIKSEEFHHSRTRNYGAQLCKGDYIVYITQDALPFNSEWLSNLVNNCSKKDVAAVYSRQIAYPDSNPMEKFFYSYFYPEIKQTASKKNIEDPLKYWMEYVSSDVSSCYKRDIWEKIKFREDVDFAEDKDFSIRALNLGYKAIYEPKSIVFHSHKYNIFSNFKRRYLEGRMLSKILKEYESNYSMMTKVGVKYFKAEVKFLLKQNPKWIPYACLYELSKYLGMKIGRLMA